MSAATMLALQRSVGNRATTLLIQRIEETHAWIAAMKSGNAKLAMAQNNAETSAWLTAIGDFSVRKGFTPYDSKGKVMAFMKPGSMAEAIKDAEGFGMDVSKPKTVPNMHSKQPASLFGDRDKGMTLRPFSASSKDTVAAIDFMVGVCRFEFKYLDPAAALAAGHYGAPSSSSSSPSGASSNAPIDEVK